MTIPITPSHVSRRNQLLLGITIILCTLVYLRGLFGSFVFDDFGNIVDNPALRSLDGSWERWLALAVSSNAGVLRRPISMLSFGLDYRLFGLSALGFKLTNLAIHLLNGVLLYSLGIRIAKHLMPSGTAEKSYITPEQLALCTTALWLLHPLNVSSVVYIVQRMNELATMFILLGLLCYAEGRELILRHGRGMMTALTGLVAFGLLAIFSKENGAMIIAYALIIECTCYGFATQGPQQGKLLKAFFLLTLALPILLFLIYIVVHPQWIATGYAGRDFSFYQRQLSEARILCIYLLWIVLPDPTWMGIFHDDIPVSTGLFRPVMTAASILFLLSLIVTAWRLRRRYPGITFAIAWFLIGHVMESSVLPLELIFEHRNYLPMTGLLLGLVCTLAPLAALRLGGRQVALIGVFVTLVFAGLTAIRANDWGSQLRLAMAEAEHHPGSSRALYEAGRAIIFDGTAKGRQKAAEEQAIPYFERGRALDPTDVYTTSSLILIRGSRGLGIDADLADLAQRIRHIKQGQINPFLVVMTAATEGRINVSPKQMELLVDAALDNSRFPATMRAMILNNYGHYQFRIVHDNQAAVTLTLAAAAQDPQNPLFEINLTKLALALGDNEHAREHLKIAVQLNKAGLYDQMIDKLKSQTFGNPPSD